MNTLISPNYILPDSCAKAGEKIGTKNPTEKILAAVNHHPKKLHKFLREHLNAILGACGKKYSGKKECIVFFPKGGVAADLEVKPEVAAPAPEKSHTKVGLS